MTGKRNNSILIVGIIVFIIIFLVSSGSLAYFLWQTSDAQKTEVTFTIDQYFECAADGGGNITNGNAFIAPTSCTNSTHAIKRVVKVKPTIYGNDPVLMSLWLDVNLLDSGLSNSQNFRYSLTTSSTSCTSGVIESGTFKGKTVGDKVKILEQSYLETLTDTYYLYIWLDGAETSPSTMDQKFNLSINGSCTSAPEPQPYVVYSSSDNSLRIYKRNEDELSGIKNEVSNKTNVFMPKYTNEEYNINDIALEDGNFFVLEKDISYTEEQLPWYEYRDEVKKIIFEDEIRPVNMDNWFKGMSNVEYIDVSKINTSRVTSMYHTFDGMSSLKELDLSNFDTSKVTNMSTMFQNCSSLTSLDLSNFDTSNVTVMHVMFMGMTSLKELDISSFDTSNVTSMYSMFQNCSSLTSLDLSNFDTSNVNAIGSMFNNMSNLTSLDLSNFNTSKITDMDRMFQGMTKLENLNLSNFNTSNVTSFYSMFSYDSSLVNLDLSSFDTSKVTDTSKMFRDCTGLRSLDFRNANFSGVTSYTDMFSGVSSNINIIASNNDARNFMRTASGNSTWGNINIVSELS